MKCEIIKLDNFGRGITFYNDKICFIDGAYPGDVISFDIVLEKSKYIEGKINKIYSFSKDRVESKCPYFKECGGCVFQEYSYKMENKFKKDKLSYLVEKSLNKKDFVSDIIYSDDLYYRNKIVLHGFNKKIGLYKSKSNDIVEIDKCILCNDKINEVISIINKISGIDEVMIRTSNDLKSILIDIKGNVNDYQELLKLCDVLVINNKIISDKESIITSIGDKKYYLSSKSFFQVNLKLVDALFNEVFNVIKKIKPNYILDLYCGTGSFGIYASSYVSKVIGIDCSKSNIEDAKKNAKLNGINNIEFICDKVENVINQYSNIDLIVVDPPRSGLDKKTLAYLSKIKSQHIIYVSCDPVTLVRDLKWLSEQYDILKITPFNMFPKTYHVETVSVLCRKNIEK